ncbi:hypothetical protein VE04_09349 [Pseudogymnoascus sp. 24MN13]|nr:hypothetical protein VE04_09349 [Pseudogymnoascus sp. 24MN13]
MWLIFRLIASIVFLFSIILSIPIAFDVGGRDSGLAHSLALFCFDLTYSTLRSVSPKKSWFRYALVQIVGVSQWVIIPALLIWSLNRFTVDSNTGGDWLAKTDTWMIGLLIVSASIISSSVYFLWRITNFPEIGNVDATLIGVTITTAVFLCAWGIGSGRGNPVESSLLFAYVVLCIYQIFTDYLPSPEAAAAAAPEPRNHHSPTFQTITPSVIISLAYRIFVFYAATRIIPSVRDAGARGLSREPTLEDDDGAGWFLGVLSWFGLVDPGGGVHEPADAALLDALGARARAGVVDVAAGGKRSGGE